MAVFLINSRLGLLSAAHKSLNHEPHFSRSYVCILPSSLTRGRSCALDYSSFLPVSVSGTVPTSLALDSISRHHGCFRFASTFSPLPYTPGSEGGFSCLPQHPACFDRDNRRPAGYCLTRPAFGPDRSHGLFTMFPSATDFSLALGADLPGADCLYPGDLRFSADGDLTRLFVTYACILSSVSSRAPHGHSFMGQRNAPLPVMP